MTGFGSTPTTTTQGTLATDQFPISSVAPPGQMNGDLIALKGGPVTTDGNTNKLAAAATYTYDGENETLGAKTDAAWSGSGAGSEIAILKKLVALLTAAITVSGSVTTNAGTNTSTAALALETGGNLAASKTDLDAINTAIGAISDVAYSGSGNGTEIALLKKIVAELAATLTISGSVTANAGTNLNTSSLALETGGNLASAKTDLDAINTAVGTQADAAWSGSGSGSEIAILKKIVAELAATLTVSGSGNFTVTQGTGSNLHAVLDSGSTTAVTQATGSNLHTVVDSGAITATTNADTTIGGTTAPAKELLIAGKTNDGTPQYQPLPEGTGGRSVIVEGVAGGTAVPVSGTFWQATQPVSGTVTTNAGTNLNTSALALDTSVNGVIVSQGSTTSGEKGPLIQGAVTTAAPSYTTAQTSPISLTTAGAVRTDASATTQPISAASLPLPSGASTAAKQPALGTAGSASADVLTVQGIASMTALKVDGSATTQPENLTQIGGTNVVTGGASGLLAVGGPVASGASNADNPVKAGAVYNSTQPTVTTGQVVDVQATSRGAQIVATGADTFNAAVTGTVTANAGTNLNTSSLALETGGNLATLAGAVTSAKVQTNTAQINGVAPTMGNGVSGTGVQRVTIASDSTGQITANAGTNLNTSALALDTSVNGVIVSQGSTTSGEKGPLIQGAVTTSAPTYTTAQTSPISLTTAGAVRTDASATTQPVSGTVTVTATNLQTNLNQVAGSAIATAATGIAKVGVTDGSGNAITSTSNALDINIKSGGGSGFSVTDEAAWTAGTSALVPTGGVFNDSAAALTSGQEGTVRVTNNRAMHANLRDASGNQLLGSKTSANSVPVVVASDQGAVPVSGTVSITANSAVNVAQVAGTTTDTNSGNKSAGTQRVVLATDQPQLTNALKVDGSAVTQPVSGTVSITANSAVNVAQVNGVTTTTGNGVSGTGVQRVTLASDSTGQVTLAAGANTVGAVTQASGPWTSNVTQFGGTNVSTGTGASGTGIPRVTVANDSQVQLWDGTTGPIAAKAATTSPTLADKALVQVLSPNNTGLPVNAPKIVQSTSNKSSGSVASLAKAFTSNNVAGNSIVVVCAVGNGTAPTISDSANTYTQAVQVANGSALNVAIFYAVNIAAGANTVTVNNGGTTASIAMEIYEVSGLLSLAPSQLDQTASGSGSSGTASTSNVSALSPNEYAFAGVGIGTAAQTITAGSGWTNDSGQQNPTTPAGLFSFVSMSQYLGSLKAVTPQATFTSEPWAIAVATFRPVILGVEGTSKITDGTVTMSFGQNTMANSLPVAIASDQGTLTVAGSGNFTVAQATGSNLHAVLDAGSAVIGHVINDASSAVIGHVIADSGSTTAVTQATASNLNAQVVGAAASGASNSGNPVKAGGVFNTTQPTVTNGQAVDAQMTARGALIVASGTDTINVTAAAGTNLNTSALALETGGNLATLAGAVTSAKVQENVAQINGVAPLMGNGVTGTGSQRVTIASDNTAFSVNAAQSGTWTVQPGNTANTTAWKVDGSAVTQPVSATNLQTNLNQIAGSSISTAATGVQKVGMVGNAGATVDSTVGAGSAPTNAVVIGSVYNSSAPAPTNGQAMAVQADQAGNTRVFPAVALATLSAWNSGTSLNATQTVFTNSGAEAVLVQLTQTTTLTAGAITFEVNYDGSTWVTIPANCVLDPTSTTFAQISIPYTVQASTNKQFLLNMNGAQGLRIKLSTQITGSGSVTPNYALLPFSPADGVIAYSPTAANFLVTASAGTNLNTSALALETGGNLATLAGAITSAKMQANVAQINGVTPLMGNGTTGAGSQRVTIASDNTAFTVNAAQSGTWTVQPGNTANTTAWLITPQATTTGGSTISHTMSAASTNATSLKGSAGLLYGYSLSNNNASARYVKFYNKASSPTVGTDTPVTTVQVPGNSTVIRAYPVGVTFGTGIAWAATGAITDADTTAIGANDLSIDIDYK